MDQQSIAGESREQASGGMKLITDLLNRADIRVNGTRPWDIRVHNPRMAQRTVTQANLGLGEAYMDGDWDCDALDQFFDRILRTRLDRAVSPLRLVFHALRFRLLNLQTSKRAFQVGEQHYDIGNDLYRAMLDERLTYTCGYWEQATTLEEAQEAKLDLICRKLDLQPGQRVLDIGCGWGSFAKFAAERYGVQVVGITISREQATLARELCAGLPVEIRVQDYRDVRERFDHLVSVGMFEHVGRKNFREYMEVAARCLRGDGLFLLHTIGKNLTRSTPDPWIDKYIFPNGDLPSLTQISQSVEDVFVIEDVHSFGPDYDRTLMAWHENFEAAWPTLRDSYGERFYRMWKYYLLSCAGAFRSRGIQLWQFVLSREGVRGGYRRPA
ncbi:MAG TPA: cyclopropane fatty acyl phospholipid synthase [Phycisphaerales bacterium]|nr:cyclopropane fatty acyl phospholipid synthase [Phycisphaerales bacterium]